MILYHLLNRGVDKRDIFMDDKDRFRFIHDLFEFNDIVSADANFHRHIQMMDVGRPSFRRRGARKLLVRIHAFCLMPNHYHLLVSPLNPYEGKNNRKNNNGHDGRRTSIIEKEVSLFMKKLNGGYAKYFNERHERTGALFQGKYKAVPITGDPHFSWIPYYIHFNPLDLTMPEWRKRGIKNIKKAEDFLKTYHWSSHLDYLGIKNFPSLTQRDFFMNLFGGEKGYTYSISEILKGFSTEENRNITLE